MNKKFFALVFLICSLIFHTEQSLYGQNNIVDFSIVSWNLQTFGNVNTSRQTAFQNIIPVLMEGNNYVIAAQEVANETGRDFLLSFLPGESSVWDYSFVNTSNSQDNGIWFNSNEVSMNAEGFVFNNQDSALHPIRWAHLNIEGYDFTIFSLHLTYANQDAQESKRELVSLLNYLVNYFNNPENDPDVIICGDFNLATDYGKTLSERAGEEGWITIDKIIKDYDYFNDGENKLWTYIDEPTSRPHKEPLNNYDHFIISNSMKENLVSCSRVDISLIDNEDIGQSFLVSDHYPVRADFSFTVDVKEGKLPKEYKLIQNYPNPFNPTTTIAYSIPKRSEVTLKIYNVLGREIETPIDAIKNAGDYKIIFNASELTSGVYFCKLYSGDFMQAKKLLLFK